MDAKRRMQDKRRAALEEDDDRLESKHERLREEFSFLEENELALSEQAELNAQTAGQKEFWREENRINKQKMAWKTAKLMEENQSKEHSKTVIQRAAWKASIKVESQRLAYKQSAELEAAEMSEKEKVMG